MPNLDDAATIRKYDKSGMIETIGSFAKQCDDAEAIGREIELPGSFKRKVSFDNIVFAGVGGSAIGADILRSYALDEAKIPVFVNRNYKLPAFVGRRSLVIVSSYSGNTEETLGAYNDAKTRRAKIIVVTSGGELCRMASRDRVPCIAIPGGLPPRCALGYSFFPLLSLLSKIGVIKDKSAGIKKTIEILNYLRDKKIGPDVARSKNIAKIIAKNLYLKFPVIYGGQDHIDAVVTRWRSQFAENAKTLSSSHLLPEMNHNEIVGWGNPEKIMKSFVAVILRDRNDHPRVSKRMDITKKLIKKSGASVIEVNSFGKDLLARIFSLIYIGDFASFYLAILNGRDPTPVERITYLKRELAR